MFLCVFHYAIFVGFWLHLGLDCVDIEVAKTATVAQLKQAVESVFSHLPNRGPKKISWYYAHSISSVFDGLVSGPLLVFCISSFLKLFSCTIYITRTNISKTLAVRHGKWESIFLCCTFCRGVVDVDTPL